MLFTLLVFQFDISGNDTKEEHNANIEVIIFNSFGFHLDKSGKDINDGQS